MIKRRLFCLLAVVICIAACLGITACTGPDGAYNVTLKDERGIVLTTSSARTGELVRVKVSDGYDYEVSAVYVNGNRIAGDTFVMPASDVVVSVVLASTAEGAHRIIISDTDALGRTVADYESANAGATVTLTSFVSYANTVKAYLVNGTQISGNTFVMPEADVTVTTLYDNMMPPTDVTLTVEQNYQSATSYWYASYSVSGVTVRAVVEDNIVFTAGTLSSFAFGDNAEFVIGPRTEATGLNGCYKVLVSPTGEYYFDKYNEGWYSADKNLIQVSAALCSIDEYGFNGYFVNVFIPYSAIGTTYTAGYGNITMAPAMRNTLNALKSNWASYSGMECNWNDAKTHLLITDGGFIKNNFSVDNLFIGSRVLSSGDWEFFYQDMAPLGDIYSMAADAGTAYWTERLGQIADRKPYKVFFSYGDGNGTVMSEFAAVKRFIDGFNTVLPNTELKIISAVPTIGADADPYRTQALNSMVEDYAEECGAEFIDLGGAIFKNGTVNYNFYASANRLSFSGYALLSKLILLSEGMYEEPRGEWGDVGSYTSSSGWVQSGNKISLRAGSTRKTYFKSVPNGDFVFTAEITAQSVYNGDSFPKFGLTLQNGTISHSFFIYGDNRLTAKTGGVVAETYNGYDWENVSEVVVPDLEYILGKYATLRLERSGGAIKFYINSTLIYSGDPGYGTGDVVIGAFAFNTSIEIRNWNLTEGGM